MPADLCFEHDSNYIGGRLEYGYKYIYINIIIIELMSLKACLFYIE